MKCSHCPHNIKNYDFKLMSWKDWERLWNVQKLELTHVKSMQELSCIGNMQICYVFNCHCGCFKAHYIKCLYYFVMQLFQMKPWYFFRLLPSNCLNWKIYCDDHSSLTSTTAVQYEFHIYFTSFHCTGRSKLNKLTLLPMCGFTAQLVEHRTGIAEVMGSNTVETLQFFRLLPSNCLNWKIYCDDHSPLTSTMAVQYEFHIYFTSYFNVGDLHSYAILLFRHKFDQLSASV